MATSGEILSNNVVVSGSATCRLRIEWQLASQNVGGNYSTINWQAYIDFFGCDAQLDNGHVNTNVGAVYNNGGRVYNYAGNFSNHTVTMGSGSFTIGHNSDGTQSLQMNGSVAVYQSGTATCGTTTWSLPTIPRYAVIDGGPNINFVTDAAIEFAWHADRSCDYMSWWSTAYDGGGHHDTPTSGQGWWTIDWTNLPSNKQFDITVAVRNAASGLWTQSGTIYATTLAQNNFVGKRVI